MRVLIINSGSSSLKFGLYEGSAAELAVAAGGSITAIGGEATRAVRRPERGSFAAERRAVADHHEAVQWMFEWLKEWDDTPIEAVGHRVVHGGERFQQAVRIDREVLAAIEGLSELAPLHNPPSVSSIRAVQAVLGTVPMVAVFDTAFHQTLPPPAARYAIPGDLAARHRVRRYGFHGIAHASMVEATASALGRPVTDLRLVTLQLGNGCSATAVHGGKSVETSMGFTPLEGLVMGTRSGDIDPSVVSYLARKEGLSTEQIEQLLNQQSGLLGVSGVSNDMRRVIGAAEQGSKDAALAIDLFCHRVRKYVGAYLAVLGGADAVVFGGGIGEHQAGIRARICDRMGWCGLMLDGAKNHAATDVPAGEAVCISRDGGRVAVYVAGVDEERMIARETLRVMGSR